MLKNLRQAYREGRQASDLKYHHKMLRKGLDKAPKGATTILATRVGVLQRNILLRYGWTEVGRSGTYVHGTGAAWTDSFTLAYELDQAVKELGEDALTG